MATERLSAVAANSPAKWEAMRFAPQMPEPCPTYFWRLEALCNAVKWALVGQSLTPSNSAVLDLSAGNGSLGTALRHLVDAGRLPALAYHATEQTRKLAAYLRDTIPGSSAEEWRFEDSEGRHALAAALEDSEDTFLRAYPVVVLSHVLEHVADYYGLLDEVWPFVAPGGFLVVAVPRQDEHKTHHTTWDWDRLIAVLRQYAGYGYPLACWEYGAYADLVVAVGKPPEREDDGGEETPAPPSAPDEGQVQVAAQIDRRIQTVQVLNQDFGPRPLNGRLP